MTYVVTENCILCKHTTCVEVCPTDAFREGPNFLVIAPDACVDCDICRSECPIDAIYSDEDLPADQAHFLPLNAELALVWQEITEAKDPLPEYQKWEGVEDKLALLER